MASEFRPDHTRPEAEHATTRVHLRFMIERLHSVAAVDAQRRTSSSGFWVQPSDASGGHMRKLLILTLPLLVAAAPTGYRTMGEIKIGGEGGWDYLTVDSAARRLYVSHATHVVVVDLDAAKATVSKKYSLSPCDGPSGLAIDTKSRRLFSVCSNRLMAVSDPDAGKVVVTLAIGAGSDGAAFDPGTGYTFSSNGDGTLTVVQQTGGKWDVVENIATERGARTIAVDEKTHKVYLPTAKTAPSASGGRASYLPNTFKVLIVGK